MKEEASIYAMVMTIVIIVTVVLLTVFVIKCWQMKEEEIQRDQVQSETETNEPEPETPETAAAVSEADVSEDDHPETVPETAEQSVEGIVNGPEEAFEEIQAEPETAAAVRDTLGCPEEILIELRARLTAYGIEWWEPYALAQMFQESHFNPYAENKNGLDKGLIQYRITYWPAVCSQHGLDPATSIFDWKAQLQIYVQDTARRIGSGCSVQDTISRHMMSDYGPFCATYVKDVMRWVR